MSTLCFGELVNTVRKFTRLNQTQTVELLLSPVTDTVEVINQIGASYRVTCKEASLLANRKKSIIKSIVDTLNNPAVIRSVESFYDNCLKDKLELDRLDSLISELSELVRNDPSIPNSTRDRILNFGSRDDFSAFLGEILLYSLRATNTACDAIPQSSSPVVQEKTGFQELNDQSNGLYCKGLFKWLSKIFSNRNVPFENLLDALKEKYNITIDADTLAQYFSGTLNCKYPLPIIRCSCSLLNLTMDDLFIAADRLYFPNYNPDRLVLDIAGSPSLISNPLDSRFRGYFGTYYVFFTPTHSNDSTPLKGTLTFENAETKVRALFKLDTRQNNESGEPVLKTYEGTLICSTSVSNCYCVLSSHDIGEMGFITFRHYNIHHQKRDCLLATSMTTSAGNIDRNPVIHRMLLSREDIKEQDLSGIVPFLSLNSSNIIIPEEEWNRNEDIDPVYNEVMDFLLEKKLIESALFYQFDESTIKAAFKKITKKNITQNNEIRFASFISSLRAKAITSRYNKVSRKAEENVRNYLIEHGYFKKPVVRR